MPHHAHVILDGRRENIRGITTESLSGKLQKPILRRRNDVLNGESSIIDSILTAYKILRHQRTIHPWQHMVMQRVHLTESRAHLSTSGDEARRQRGKRNVAFFQVDSFFAKGNEEVAARVR